MNLRITRAWRHDWERGRIHYLLLDADTGRERRLYTEPGTALHAALSFAMERDKEAASVARTDEQVLAALDPDNPYDHEVHGL